MFNINDGIFSWRTVSFGNGRNISVEGIGELQNFDERKSEDASNVEKIAIYSTIGDVNISVSNSSKIEAHFYGQAGIDGDIYFDVRVVNRKLMITLILIGNCYNSNFKLDVTVPHKTFKAISTISLSGDVTLSEGVSMERLKVDNQFGGLKTSATFGSASITTLTGDVELYIDAKKHINVEIFTTYGDVSVEFDNVGYIDLYACSKDGDVRNLHKNKTGYTADVDIFTIEGEIKIR